VSAALKATTLRTCWVYRGRSVVWSSPATSALGALDREREGGVCGGWSSVEDEQSFKQSPNRESSKHDYAPLHLYSTHVGVHFQGDIHGQKSTLPPPVPRRKMALACPPRLRPPKTQVSENIPLGEGSRWALLCPGRSGGPRCRADGRWAIR
jgi:hypothetical protein